MPRFEKIDINKDKTPKVVVFIPEEAKINYDQLTRMTPPITEYENRRSAIGKKAIRQITGK